MDSDLMTGYALGQDSNSGNCNGGMGWGGEWFWGLILLAFLWGGNGFGGFGGNGGGYVGTVATQADIQRGFDTQSILSKLDGINSGICDGFYAVNTSMLNGFNGVDNAVCNLGYQTAQLANGLNTTMMQGFNSANVVALQNQNALQSQLSDCCCRTERAIDGINYNMATNTCALQTSIANSTRDIIDSQTAGTRAILDYLCQEKISDLQNENQSLKLAASQQAQNNYLVSQLRPCPVPAYPACPVGAYPGYAGTLFGNGCNTGCCGCNG